MDLTFTKLPGNIVMMMMMMIYEDIGVARQ